MLSSYPFLDMLMSPICELSIAHDFLSRSWGTVVYQRVSLVLILKLVQAIPIQRGRLFKPERNLLAVAFVPVTYLK